ncbi:helix-hairpin-helix domain-containing protein [Pseudomonas palleroniana]|uniref:Competence protein ComEA n=1 Tax=Pseudomonas palleroniana TaxID=191390 RepID=A0A1H5G919_9PSED|nr:MULTISPECIES: helix-hairpin-helix domain-containing protein [Pseudomonas]KAB0565131.1 helix-hairpin-helix domain-containing protein [Pseudomonas palleroniana]MBM9488077.1 helix-hairpin-helix domain-containing protein [Pseudomonas sp. ICBG1301]PTC31822.1 helix-hairpin-helix domain-containing protein [Pseudomonas palleroniana]SEE12100.1 competence protein ComEA [Pseudomonas palleroniana]
MYNAVFSALFLAFLTSATSLAYAVPASKAESAVSIAVQSGGTQQSVKVKLNSADAETLRRDLFGIGASKAKAIVAYRESNGPFTVVDELLEVKGIGKALLEKNRDRLEVN